MNLTARERRLLAIGALVLALALVWFMIGAPLAQGLTARAAERQRLVRELAAARRLIQQRPAWRARALALRADDAAFAPADLDQASARAADAALSAATGEGAAVSAVTAEAPADGLARARMQMRADMTQLVGVLKDLEGRRPYLVVQSLSVAHEPDASAAGRGGLSVTLVVGAPYVAQRS
jgi:type II secretory pathway component PulM